MSIDRQNPELLKTEAFIDNLIQVDFSGSRKNDIDLKLDLFERTIELLRIKNKHLVNKLRLEEFIQSDILMDKDILRYSLSQKTAEFGCGTKPIQLQPLLLLFLLIYHKEEYRVLDIIRLFIEKIWDYLDTLDFKKTETGVYRCYTNTRFAANKLRDYSFLRYGKKEAYKTWVLSLPGFLVGSVVLQKYRNNWQIPRCEQNYKFPLHSDILDAYYRVEHYEDFVDQLAKICIPEKELFYTFEPVLTNAYKLLGQYWNILRDKNLSHSERQQGTSNLIEQLDLLPNMDQFYVEFSKCLNINRLLNEVE